MIKNCISRLTKKYLVLFLAAAFIFTNSCFKKNDLEMYAIKYGTSLYHSRYIYKEDSLNTEIDFAWIFYLIKYYDKTILVDTGFSNKYFIKLFEVDHRQPLDLLDQLKISPEDITDVIITHSHFDHIENVYNFPNANIYIQKAELDWFLKRRESQKAASFLRNNKKLITFDDSILIYDKFKIKKIGSHTIGSSIVSFLHNYKEYFLIGDEFYLKDNYLNIKPTGTYYSTDKNKKFIESLQSDNNIILTFHDPMIVKGEKKYIKRIIP